MKKIIIASAILFTIATFVNIIVAKDEKREQNKIETTTMSETTAISTSIITTKEVTSEIDIFQSIERDRITCAINCL